MINAPKSFYMHFFIVCPIIAVINTGDAHCCNAVAFLKRSTRRNGKLDAII